MTPNLEPYVPPLLVNLDNKTYFYVDNDVTVGTVYEYRVYLFLLLSVPVSVLLFFLFPSSTSSTITATNFVDLHRLIESM